jgi:hypothetical protein
LLQQCPKLALRDAKNLEIDVFGRVVPQAIPYPATNNEGASARIAYSRSDGGRKIQ